MADPDLVARARESARRLRFELSSIPEVGRLLHVVVTQRPRARVAEVGTGVGVGTAWIADALGDGAGLVSVEVDPALAAAARELFEGRANVRVLTGDWHELLPIEAPFDVVFFDGGHWKTVDVERESSLLLELVAPGGLVVIDDLTPGWPGPDPVRRFWLEHAALSATEILTTPETAAILAARR